MDIPLPDMMRAWRERDFARGNPPFKERLALKLWAFAAKRPRLYHALPRRSPASWRGERGARGQVEPLPVPQGLDGDTRPSCPARPDVSRALRAGATGEDADDGP